MGDEELKRKRGRPRTGRKPKFNGRWVPATWKPEYEEIVRLSCTGMSNKELAAKYNFTAIHIGNILKSPQAEEIKANTIALIKAKSELVTEQRIVNLTEKSLEIAETVLNDTSLIKSHPFAMFDRAATFLKGIGKLKTESDNNVNNVQNNVVIINKESGDKIASGLAELKEIGMLTSGKPVIPAKTGKK